jgi:hypothetical protein
VGETKSDKSTPRIYAGGVRVLIVDGDDVVVVTADRGAAAAVLEDLADRGARDTEDTAAGTPRDVGSRRPGLASWNRAVAAVDSGREKA